MLLVLDNTIIILKIYEILLKKFEFVKCNCGTALYYTCVT